MMKKILCLIFVLIILVGCGGHEMDKIEYTRISTTEAASVMESRQEDYLLVDVREVEEFVEGHIQGAINLPLSTILEEDVNDILPNKSQTIFIYCRSGNRSQTASAKLCELGYTNIIEMGGIIDWTGQIVK